MANLFGGGKIPKTTPPPTPRPVRMPTEMDPAVLAAVERQRAAAGNRRGFRSTILTNQTRQTVGSSGQTLGA